MDSLRPENVSRRAMDRSGRGERGVGVDGGERERESDLIIGRGISVGSPGTISGKRNKREVEMIVPRAPLSLVATIGFITSRGHHGVFRERA